jgi:hypothetical protein
MKYGEYWFHLQYIFYCKFSHFRTFYTEKTSLERKKNFRLSRGVAGVGVGFWTKFEVQLAQPSEVLQTNSGAAIISN